MNKNNSNSYSFLILLIIFSTVSLVILFLGNEYNKYNSNIKKKEYCSYYIGYSQNFLNLYIKRKESTELIEFIIDNQKTNPDIAILNIFLSKRANIEYDYSNIIMDVADICLQNKRGDFLKEIFKINKNNNIVRSL